MLRTGALLHGTYRIDGYLSSGGFGNSYVVTHVNFNERYALKEFFMRGVSQRDANATTVSVSNMEKVAEFTEQMEKFKKEAQRLRRLRNDHIVRVHDLFEENGTVYYVMDYIDGENLRERLNRRMAPMSEAEVTDVLRQVLDALREVHTQGIWHMDLKPANVMIDRDGVVKLIDFGASKQFNSRTGGALSSSAVTFTNGYAPIEQMERSYEKFGPWTDFYALGATIYNLLTGCRPPMPSDINDDLTADKRQALPMPKTVSTRMRDLVLWLMRTNRVERPASVEVIENYLNNPSAKVPFSTSDAGATVISRPVEAPRPMVPKGVSSSQTVIASPSSPRTADKKPNKNLIYGAIAAAAVLLLVGLFALLGRCSNDATEEVPVAPEEMVKEAPISVTNLPVTIPLGECVYEGEVNDDSIPNGRGTAVFSNGDRCEGTFVNGNVDGDDIKYYFYDGDWFEGTVKDNSLYEGVYHRKDGSRFEGTFKDNDPDQGTWYDKNGNPT